MLKSYIMEVIRGERVDTLTALLRTLNRDIDLAIAELKEDGEIGVDNTARGALRVPKEDCWEGYT